RPHPPCRLMYGPRYDLWKTLRTVNESAAGHDDTYRARALFGPAPREPGTSSKRSHHVPTSGNAGRTRRPSFVHGSLFGPPRGRGEILWTRGIESLHKTSWPAVPPGSTSG